MYHHCVETRFLTVCNVNYLAATRTGLTLLLLNTTCPVLANSVDPDQLASSEANWSGAALLAITEFSETPDPAYFYAYFCFCTRKISFRGFSFTRYCHRTSKLNFKDVPRTSEISFVRRNRYPRCPNIVKKPAHF